jgi:DNA-binding NarL/FixJ family response regulator
MRTGMNLHHKINIFIIEDNTIVSDLLEIKIKQEKDFNICGLISYADTSIKTIKNIQPDILLADASVKDSSSVIDLITRLIKYIPGLKILIISVNDQLFNAENCFKAGAKGYMLQNEMEIKVLYAIRYIIEGYLYLSEKIQSQLYNNLIQNSDKKITNPLVVLTNRELEILRLFGYGMTSDKTAKLLNISKKTVDTYKFRIKDKLNIKNNTELMRLGIDIINHEKVL